MSLLYGFESLKDVLARRVTEVGAAVVNNAINQSVQEHNRQLEALLGLLAKPLTEFKVTYRTPSSARLQPLDEHGRARPISTRGSYDVSFPIQSGGAAWGTTRILREKMTVQEANDATTALISADIRWMRDHALASLFANASWSFIDEQHGALSIKGLANGDTDLYQLSLGADSGAADDHYKAQANAISDLANPFNADMEELTEHPENGGEVVALVASDLKSSIEGLSNYIPVADPNVQLASTRNALVGNLGVALPGRLLGYVDKVWVAEWKAMPANYYVMATTAGEPPLGLREHPETSLRGFNRTAERNDHPFYESQWERHCGFGAWNRVGALVRRVGNANYAVPANFSAPMG
jgi:hypothetical protein